MSRNLEQKVERIVDKKRDTFNLHTFLIRFILNENFNLARKN